MKKPIKLGFGGIKKKKLRKIKKFINLKFGGIELKKYFFSCY